MINPDFRVKGIGGSDLAAILKIGLTEAEQDNIGCKDQTPLALYYQKKHNLSFSDNAGMSWGREQEPIICADFECREHVVLDRNIEIVDPKNPIFRGNVDGKEDSQKLLFEAKTARFRGQWGEPGSTDIPIAHMAQVAYYAHILDSDKIVVGVKFLGDDTVYYYNYYRDETLENDLRARALDFWERYVVADVEPEPITPKDYKEYVNTAHITAPENIVTIYKEMKNLQESCKKFEAHKKFLKEWVKKECKGKAHVLHEGKALFKQTLCEGRKGIRKEWMRQDGLDVSKYEGKGDPFHTVRF